MPCSLNRPWFVSGGAEADGCGAPLLLRQEQPAVRNPGAASSAPHGAPAEPGEAPAAAGNPHQG